MGHRGRLACACAVALVACGDNRGTTTASGSRLRLYWAEYEGGIRQVIEGDFWDDERQEPCLPRRWNDGNTYCTPKELGYLVPHYVDATCTEAVDLAETVPEPPYVARFETVDGEDIQTFLGTPEPASLAMYWELVDDVCQGPYSGSGRMFYRAGREVPRSELVRFRALESTGNGRVGVRATTSDDGLYLPTDFEDRNLHSPCFLNAFTSDAASCVPTLSGDVQYRDSDCSEPVLVTNGSDDDPPAAIRLGPTCEPRAYAVAAETSEAPAYTRVDGACVESTQVGSPWYSLREQPVAMVPRARVPGTGQRLEEIAMSVDGVTVPARQLFDTEIGAECARAASPRQTGVYHCVPRDVGFVNDGFFDDAACTIPIEIGLVVTGTDRVVCDGSPSPAYARDFSGATLIRHLLGRRTAPTYVRSDGACQVEVVPGYALHDLGEAIPDAAWARATIVRE